jgi:predicted dehydrogenase
MTKQPGNSRREFLKATTLAGAGFWIAGTSSAADKESKSANGKLQFACIGVGGKGRSDSDEAGKNGEVVAICDIDDKTLESAKERFPNAKQYTDFRELLDDVGDEIDAVTVSTPDHTHAVAAAAAMKMGKACFCQKPLTHSVSEARRLAELARKMKVATQMGNQGTALEGLHKAAARIRDGAIGDVSEIHVWTNRPIWPQGVKRQETSPVPPHIHWDEFLGPAPYRPYAKGYHPFAWRGWWDFGTGALGDMACHTVNMPFMALDLRNPTTIEAESSGHDKDSYAKWAMIHFKFPKTDRHPELVLNWYDGGKKPDAKLTGGIEVKGSGCLLIGSEGRLYSPDDYGAAYQIFVKGSNDAKEEFRTPSEEARKANTKHFSEFVDAIRGGEPATSNFADYAGPLTETILLGNLAVWAGKKIEWDAENMKAKGNSDVDVIIAPGHPGYEL